MARPLAAQASPPGDARLNRPAPEAASSERVSQRAPKAPAKPQPRGLVERAKTALVTLALVLVPAGGTAAGGAAAGVAAVGFAAEVSAVASLTNLGVTALAVVGVIVGAVVGVVVLNATGGLYISSVADFIGTMQTASFGNEFGDSMLDIVILIVSIVAPFALLGLAISVIVLRHRGGKGTT